MLELDTALLLLLEIEELLLAATLELELGTASPRLEELSPATTLELELDTASPLLEELLPATTLELDTTPLLEELSPALLLSSDEQENVNAKAKAITAAKIKLLVFIMEPPYNLECNARYNN
jgi:hypothetical protein